jgi:hypothetical protein
MAVKKFMKESQQLFKDLGLREDKGEEDDESLSPNELVETMNSIDDEEIFDQLTEGILGSLAQLCGARRMELPTGELNEQGFPVVEIHYEGGSPSHAALSALPYRPFMGFFGYLMENLMNPEVSRPGTTISRRRLHSA